MRRPVCLFAVAAACGEPPPPPPIPPTTDLDRDVISTALTVDVGTREATAVVTLAPSSSRGASLEIGDLTLSSVRQGDVELEWIDAGDRLDVGVAADEPVELTIDYTFDFHGDFDGAAEAGYTLLWPYFCGNLFPCRSAPADGVRFELEVTGYPEQLDAVYPPTIPADAPPYQVAWAIGDYEELDLGQTTNGTQVSVWHRPPSAAAAAEGTLNLRAAFDWLEQTLGAYTFGSKVGSVQVAWGPGAFGGMEHHPYWHLGSAAIGDEETHVHEAVHGWFGGGIRIACWEDFVLSEGTTTYLAGRALDVVAPANGAAVWATYASELAAITPTDPVWPDSCGAVDVIADNLFTQAPYVRGAFFYRAVALTVGAEALDRALAAFYAAHVGGAATMAEMLTTIETETGFDPTACATAWLRSETIPAIGPCPG